MDFVKEAIIQNAHWESGFLSFPRVSGRLVEREVFKLALASVSRKFITVFRGLRRTGKSVLARQIARKRLEKAKSSREVAWFEFDRAMNASPDDLDSLLNFFDSQNAGMVVLDEIAFVSKWQDVLKRHYDRTETKFLVTGSSAIELDRRTSESLAGRFDTVHVKPFTLRERMALNGKTFPATPREEAVRREEMALECDEYLQAGGLPETCVEKDEGLRAAYVKNSLLDPLFYKDFPSVFPNANPDLLRKALELLSPTVGSTYQTQSIAEVLGCSHPTAGTQIELLEKTLLVKTLYNFTPSIVKQKRTAKKIVFTDNGVLRAVKPDIGMGALAENAVAAALEARHFWRDSEGREVDIILPEEKTALEVKYQSHVTGQDEKALRYFLEKRKGWRGLLLTKNEYDASDIRRIPIWKLLSQSSSRLPRGL